MERIILTKTQQKIFDKIGKHFLEAVTHIENDEDRHIATVKILSRLGCYADLLVGKK